jgi:hypothetical protein
MKGNAIYIWLILRSQSDNGKWPEEIKPFLWRYLHDRCLYNVRKDNLEALERLCQDLKQHLNLKCNSDEDNEIRRKVERQIKYVAGQWKDYGLLVKNEGVYTRAPVLQKHWRHARDKWISQVHHGVTEDLIEICPQEVPRPTSARIVTSDGKVSSAHRLLLYHLTSKRSIDQKTTPRTLLAYGMCPWRQLQGNGKGQGVSHLVTHFICGQKIALMRCSFLM